MKVSFEGLFTSVIRDLKSIGHGNAAAAIEELHVHIRQLVGGEVSMAEFAEHYCLPVPAVSGGALAVPTEIEKAFEEFKALYKPLGYRNNWPAALKKMKALVTHSKVKVEDIIAGTRAYAATNPDRQYVPAPEVFLNKRQFAYDWAQAKPERKAGPSLYDIEDHFADKIAGR